MFKILFATSGLVVAAMVVVSHYHHFTLHMINVASS